MSRPDDLEPFRSITRVSLFQEYLARERDDIYKILGSSHDMVRIHQAQGRLHLVEKQLDLLAKATSLR